MRSYGLQICPNIFYFLISSSSFYFNFIFVCNCYWQEEYGNGEEVGILKKCGHKYHVSCIRKWLLVKNACPICKASALADCSPEGWIRIYFGYKSFVYTCIYASAHIIDISLNGRNFRKTWYPSFNCSLVAYETSGFILPLCFCFLFICNTYSPVAYIFWHHSI